MKIILILYWGTTLSGSLLYGAPKHDVTEDLLSQLNLKYQGRLKKN